MGDLPRRALLRGLAGLPLAGGAAAPPDPADARLDAIAAELEALFRDGEAFAAAHPDGDADPAWDALVARYGPLEDEMADTPAATLAGVLAKARACQVPAVNDCGAAGIAASMGRDLWRLFAGGPAPGAHR